MNKALPPNFVNVGWFIPTHFLTQNERKCLEKGEISRPMFRAYLELDLSEFKCTFIDGHYAKRSRLSHTKATQPLEVSKAD